MVTKFNKKSWGCDHTFVNLGNGMLQCIKCNKIEPEELYNQSKSEEEGEL